MEYAECSIIVSQMENAYKEETGPFGEQTLHDLICKLMVDIVTFKRICDIGDEHDGFPVLREKCMWEYIAKAQNKYFALKDAVDVINYDNFQLVPYGSDVIPRLSDYKGKDIKKVNAILDKWFSILNDVSFSDDSVSADNWIDISRYLRSSIEKSRYYFFCEA